MDIKKVKGILAAGALTGIILATMLGLGLRNVSSAVAASPPPVAVQSAQASSSNLASANNSQAGRIVQREGENESQGFNDD
jgi:hypothetical protein